MATTILSIGLVVFLAHFLALQFRRTNVPDVLVLVLVGTTVGPLLGILDKPSRVSWLANRELVIQVA